jgi:hypothetical protein
MTRFLTAKRDGPRRARTIETISTIDEQPITELLRLHGSAQAVVRARVIAAERFTDHPVVVRDSDRVAHRQYRINSFSASQWEVAVKAS